MVGYGGIPSDLLGQVFPTTQDFNMVENVILNSHENAGKKEDKCLSVSVWKTSDIVVFLSRVTTYL